MKLDHLKSNADLIAEESPEFIAEWNRTALGREVAILLIEFRHKHDLTQTDLAKMLNKQQPAIARLERGESNPSIETLTELANSLEASFSINVTPVAPTEVVASVRKRKGAPAKKPVPAHKAPRKALVPAA